MKKFIIAFIIALAFTSSVQANSYCDTRQTRNDVDKCYNAVFERLNAQLLKLYTEAINSPKYSHANKVAIETNQRAWENQVNSQCRNVHCTESSMMDRINKFIVAR